MSENAGPGAGQAPGPAGRLVRSARSVLGGTGTPVWFTLLALVAGSTGTYYLSPRINATLEAQRIRTQFVITNIADLKQAAAALLKSIALLNQHMINGDDVTADVDAVLASMAELQAIMLATQFMVTDREHQQAVIEFYQASTEFQQGLYETVDGYAQNPQDAVDLIMASMPRLQRLTLAIGRLFEAIGQIGGLRPDPGAP